LLHEYLDPFTELLAEYRLSVSRVLGLDPDKPKVGRKAMLRFSDAVPTLRIAVDTKFGLFRDESRSWSLNHMYDVDAVAVAAPYCRVVVADKDLVPQGCQQPGTQRPRNSYHLPPGRTRRQA
jgi:hypothetical protein